MSDDSYTTNHKSATNYKNKRRLILKLLMLGSGGLYMLSSSTRVLAQWPADLFAAEDSDELITRLTAGENVVESDAVVVKVPPLVENPAIVPVSVQCRLDGVQSISLVLASNSYPLAGTFKFREGTTPAVSTRVKLDSPGDVIAIVHTDNGIYMQSAAVDIKRFACKAVVKQPAVSQ